MDTRAGLKPESPASYLPMDRWHALAVGPAETAGSTLSLDEAIDLAIGQETRGL
jgi:hypothetical protein